MRFFCSQKLNGKSGFAVNGDGLLYAREPRPLEAESQNTNGRGDVRSVYSSMTVDGQSMCVALSLASSHRIAVLRGVSEWRLGLCNGLAISYHSSGVVLSPSQPGDESKRRTLNKMHNLLRIRDME